MPDRWKSLDLGGNGLQAVNRRLARELRRRPVAYGLLALCAVGAHRWYLKEPVGALAYCALTVLALAAWPFALGILAFALHDLWWIERRLARVNRELRMRALLSSRTPPPPGYRGRPPEDASR